MQVFNTTEGLVPISSEDWQPSRATTRTLFSPLLSPQTAASLWEQGHGPEDVLQLHHCPERPPLRTLDNLRPNLVVQAQHLLLTSHPLYSNVLHNQHLRGLEDLLEALLQKGLASRHSVTQHQVYSVLVPDKPGLHPGTRHLPRVHDLTTKLCALYDLSREAGEEQEGREVPISSMQYWHQRLGNCQTEGPGDRPGLVLARTLDYVCQQSQFVGEARMMDIPGSTAFHRKARVDLNTIVRWLGPPTIFFSASFPPASDLSVATFVSHRAGVEGRQEQVWHVSSEQLLLTPLPGREVEGQDCLFYVHCRSRTKEDSCMFHQFCSRRPISIWRHQ